VPQYAGKEGAGEMRNGIISVMCLTGALLLLDACAHPSRDHLHDSINQFQKISNDVHCAILKSGSDIQWLKPGDRMIDLKLDLNDIRFFSFHGIRNRNAHTDIITWQHGKAYITASTPGQLAQMKNRCPANDSVDSHLDRALKRADYENFKMHQARINYEVVNFFSFLTKGRTKSCIVFSHILFAEDDIKSHPVRIALADCRNLYPDAPSVQKDEFMHILGRASLNAIPN